jgi:excisionase family DNA binding protein
MEGLVKRAKLMKSTGAVAEQSLDCTHGADAAAKGRPARVVYEVPEAGAMLGLSRNAAYQAVARGAIPSIRIGKLIRVPKVAFDRMLAEAGCVKVVPEKH